jgi:PUA domain protein
MKRYRLRKKDSKTISKFFEENYGISIKGDMEKFEFDDLSVITVENEPIILEYEGRYYFTVYGVIKFKPEKGRVVVDGGAMPYIMRGADVMKPGIVEADESIKAGDFVYVAVEGKMTPIAVGIALVDGVEMKGGKGKAVKNIHHLKDKIWNYFFVKG